MDIMDHFRAIIRASTFPTVMELGANDGYHTALMARILAEEHAQNWQLTAFEPDHRIFPRFQDETLRFDNVRQILAAISDTDGYLAMHLSDGEERRADRMKQRFSGSSSLLTPAGVRSEYPDMTFTTSNVRVHRLDTYCARHVIGPIDFIWSDIQGAELRMIDGGRGALARTRYLYTEFNDRSMYVGDASLAAILAALPGWKVVETYGSEALLRNARL